MANVDRPNGARPIGQLDGSPWNAHVREYSVDSSNATAIFPGDFVVRETDGNVAPYTGTGGGNLLGVCVAVKVDPTNLERRYLPATTAGTILVVDSPDTVFEIQEDNAGTALAATDAGANCDVLAGTGSTTTGASGHEIDRSTVGTATAQLRLLRKVDREDNAYGDWARWEAVINEHVYKSTTGV